MIVFQHVSRASWKQFGNSFENSFWKPFGSPVWLQAGVSIVRDTHTSLSYITFKSTEKAVIIQYLSLVSAYSITQNGYAFT